MILVDVHAHLDRKFFKDNIDEVIERAKQANVKAIIANGVDHETNREVLNLSEKYPIIKAALGLYPYDALERETGKKLDFDIDEELIFIQENKDKIIALGEVGLDFKDSNDEEEKKQIEIFRKIISLAKKIKKPIIVHSRKAEKEVIEILESEDFHDVVMHCFSGKLKLVDRMVANRWNFSIPTHVVRSEQVQKLVEKVPLQQLLTETDSPFLSPYRDRSNEPAYVIESTKMIAKLKGLDEKEAANIVFMNYQRIFL